MKEMPDLSGITGTKNYWKWNPVSKIGLTDAVKYLTEKLDSGWLINSVEYFLTSRKKIDGRLTIGVKLEVKPNGDAKLTLESDFATYATRIFKSTDFPSEGIYLYAHPYASPFDGRWIIMLPSEY